MLAGDIVLEDVGDVGHRLRADLLDNHVAGVLDAGEDVRLELADVAGLHLRTPRWYELHQTYGAYSALLPGRSGRLPLPLVNCR